ncbi:MAG: helix-turn-helix domain-containing protein [Candidatus Flemingiibacterium sp.]
MKRRLEDRYDVELVGGLWHIGQSGEDFSIDYYEKKSVRWKRRLHYHDFYELELVMSGSAFTCINGMRFSLSRGMMFLVRPTDVHRYELSEGERLRVCTLRFTSAYIEPGLMGALTASGPLVADISESFDFIAALLDDAKRDSVSPDCYTELLRRGIVNRLCAELVRRCTERIAEPESKNRLASSAVDLIRRSFGERLTLASAAKRLGVTPNYLGRVFSENIGLTFGQYLKRVRLIFALNMITNTDETLQRIALDCGFSSQSVFAREFRNYYKKAPTELRHGSKPNHLKNASAEDWLGSAAKGEITK